MKFTTADEFYQDLLAIRDSLLENKGEYLISGEFVELMQAVEIFGFYLASIDMQGKKHGVAIAFAKDTGLSSFIHDVERHYSNADVVSFSFDHQNRIGAFSRLKICRAVRSRGRSGRNLSR